MEVSGNACRNLHPRNALKTSGSACIRRSRSEVDDRWALKIVSYRADVIHDTMRAHHYVVRAKFHAQEIWSSISDQNGATYVRGELAGAVAGE